MIASRFQQPDCGEQRPHPGEGRRSTARRPADQRLPEQQRLVPVRRDLDPDARPHRPRKRRRPAGGARDSRPSRKDAMRLRLRGRQRPGSRWSGKAGVVEREAPRRLGSRTGQSVVGWRGFVNSPNIMAISAINYIAIIASFHFLVESSFSNKRQGNPVRQQPQRKRQSLSCMALAISGHQRDRTTNRRVHCLCLNVRTLNASLVLTVQTRHVAHHLSSC